MPAKTRDALPDYAERARRLGYLNSAYALAWGDLSVVLDIPLATLDMLGARGKGPKCFRLGRRLYVRQSDLRSWLDEMAQSEAA